MIVFVSRSFSLGDCAAGWELLVVSTQQLEGTARSPVGVLWCAGPWERAAREGPWGSPATDGVSGISVMA